MTCLLEAWRGLEKPEGGPVLSSSSSHRPSLSIVCLSLRCCSDSLALGTFAAATGVDQLCLLTTDCNCGGDTKRRVSRVSLPRTKAASLLCCGGKVVIRSLWLLGFDFVGMSSGAHVCLFFCLLKTELRLISSLSPQHSPHLSYTSSLRTVSTVAKLIRLHELTYRDRPRLLPISPGIELARHQQKLALYLNTGCCALPSCSF